MKTVRGTSVSDRCLLDREAKAVNDQRGRLFLGGFLSITRLDLRILHGLKARLAQLKESRSAEQETAGSNPQLDHQPLTL